MNAKYFAIVLLLIATCVSAAEKAPSNQKPKSKVDPNLAIATVTGPVICTHCDLGVGDVCCAGIKIGDAVIVLQGKANDELYEQRLNGILARAIGRLSVKDGLLHLNGVNDSKIPKNPKPSMVVTGRVIESATTLGVYNGKQPLLLQIAKGATVDFANGKWNEIRGELKVDRKGRVVLKAAAAKEVNALPALPNVKEKSK